MTVRRIAFIGALALALSAARAAAQAPTPGPAPARTPAVAASAPAAPARAAEKKTEPSPAAIKEGRALLARFVAGLGGAEKVRSVHDVWTRGLVTAKTDQGDMSMDVQTTMLFPDRMSQQVDGPFGRMTMIATPGGAFIVGSSSVQDLPTPMGDELLRQVRRVPLLVAQRADDPRLLVAAAGTEKIGDVDALILDVTNDGASVRWFLNPTNLRILRSSYTSNGVQGSAAVVSDYSDYRVVDGFPVAFHLEVSTNGKTDQVLALEECKINPGADAKLFEKPVFPTPAPTIVIPPVATPAAKP